MANYAMALEPGANYHSIATVEGIAEGTHTFDIAIDLAIGRENVKEDQLTFIVTPTEVGVTNCTPVSYDEETGKASLAFTGTGDVVVECVMAQSIGW